MRPKTPKPMLRGALILVHDETEEREKAVELHVKSTMIKEVHHRVKNNLQTVASICSTRRSTGCWRWQSSTNSSRAMMTRPSTSAMYANAS